MSKSKNASEMDLISVLVANNTKFLIYLIRKRKLCLRLAMIAKFRSRRFWNLAYFERRTITRRVWTMVEQSHFWEFEVPLFTEEKFKNTFRVDKATFLYLLKSLRHLKKNDTSWRLAIPLDKRLAAVLYALASSAEYRTVASLFGIGRTTLGEMVVEICKELCQKFEHEVFDAYPPTQDKIMEIVEGFAKLGFPQCYGAIDGCHIEVNPPKDEATDYYNLKGWHSTILFAAVDHRYRFTYANVGIPGRSNDSTIFECSTIKEIHTSNELFLQNTRTIEGVEVPILLIGDSAFRLSKYVMKPFPFCLEHSHEQRTFNKQLSKCRRVVENAFGHLKCRFRKIGRGLEVKMQNVSCIVKACCILHNICNNRNDKINQSWIYEQDQQKKKQQPQRSTNCRDMDVPGSSIREAIMKYFCTTGVDVDGGVLADVDENSSGDVDGNGRDAVDENSSGDVDGNDLDAVEENSPDDVEGSLIDFDEE